MTGSAPRVVQVAAYGTNRVIGVDGRIPWHLPEDFAHFKRLTLGQVLVMGRATYESIGRPLPGRTTIVVTRDPEWSADGVLVAHGVDEALAQAQVLATERGCDVVVAGGSQVYAQAMARATHQVLTEVDLAPEGDTHYPTYDRSQWRETRREPHEGLTWVWLERVS